MAGTGQGGTDRASCHRLISASIAPFPPGDVLLDLLRTADRANAEHGLSGMLSYGATRYVQFLEGPCAALDRLLHGLAQDTRHRILWTHRTGLAFRTIPPSLPMGYASEAQLRGLRLLHPPCDTVPADPSCLAAQLSAAALRLYPKSCAPGGRPVAAGLMPPQR